MKPLLLIALPALFLLNLSANAQRRSAQNKINARENPDESFYVLDADWKPIDIKKGVYLVHVRKTDSTWEWDYYNMYGPLIKIESFKDKDGNQPEGRFAYYRPNGTLDSIGSVSDGKLDKTWSSWSPSGKLLFNREYDHGHLLSEKDYRKDTGRQEKKGKEKDTALNKESEFQGGPPGWIRYLNRNLRYPDRAVNLDIQGNVIVFFTVMKDGKVLDPIIVNSVEYSLDTEATRIIRDSPDWVPGEKDGKVVKTFKKQPVSFRLETPPKK